MKKIIVLAMICSAMFFAGCGKRYVSPLETPSTTKAPEDRRYEFDFDQMNNDVIDSMQEKEIYDSFIKDLSITGDNGSKQITLNVEIAGEADYDVIDLLLTDATKAIVDSANTQDLRIDPWTEDSFGNLFEKYAYHYVVKLGDEVVREENLAVGDSVPFDPSMSVEQVAR